jgi:hypothetical protein
MHTAKRRVHGLVALLFLQLPAQVFQQHVACGHDGLVALEIGERKPCEQCNQLINC